MTVVAKDLQTSSPADGTLNGAVTTGDTSLPITGQKDMLFSGSGQYINVGTLGTFGSSMTAGITYAGWVKTTNTTDFNCELGTFNSSGNHTGLQILVNLPSAGGTRILIRDEDSRTLIANLTTGVSDGNWHFVVATCVTSTSTCLCWVDGVSKTVSMGSSGNPFNFANFGNPIILAGQYSGGIGSYWSGGLATQLLMLGIISPTGATNLWNAVRNDGVNTPMSAHNYCSTLVNTQGGHGWMLDDPYIGSNIKTYMGVQYGLIKTVNGIPIANIKSIHGVI